MRWLRIGTSEQGKVATFQVLHILESRVNKVCGGELGSYSRPATHEEEVVLGVERGDLVDEVRVLLLAMGSHGEVVGDVAGAGDVALVEVLPHPHVHVLVLPGAQQGARFLRVHALHLLLLASAAAASQ